MKEIGNNSLATKNCKEPSCLYCQNNVDFDMPEQLLEDFLIGEVALFVGSGISTESRLVLPLTLYEEVAAELGYKKCDKPFSELMERYCSQSNGKIKLLSKIKYRFDNIKSFPELYRVATKFHHEIATLPQVKTIITTNWDTYFEDECGAIPFIYPEDFAFWDTNERKVLKIHGSFNNFGSIVATKSDYKECLKNLRKGIMGSVLKSILATKTIVYIGYSFGDEDFQQIYSFVSKEMKGLSRQSYIVTLDKKNLGRFFKYGLTPIETDGTYFISIIKQHSVHKNITLPDIIYDCAYYMRKIMSCAHEQLHKKYNCVKNPEIMYCAYYQDGAMHAYDRIMALRNTGRYSCTCEFIKTSEVYKKLLKDYRHNKRYEDVAYIKGYLYAHMILLLSIKCPDKKLKLPLFYAYGYEGDIFNLKEYNKIFSKIPKFHKGAYVLAKKIIKKCNRGGKFVMHHPAYL
ncbi:MAG: SIR2 family protein [Phycisphaerae bacterium]|jgi:hypothetical protein